MFTLYTFGDSILDCGSYNDRGLAPGQLLVRNEDRLFPEFRGQDLTKRFGAARLDHRAVDGSMVDDLPQQARRLDVNPMDQSVAILTVGGNDLIGGLLGDPGPGIDDFVIDLHAFLQSLPIRPVLIGTVYDPTFGDDTQNAWGGDPVLARKNFTKLNERLVALGRKVGAPVDLHAHFRRGRPDWFTRGIEPSLIGASEIRRCFWKAILAGPLSSA